MLRRSNPAHRAILNSFAETRHQGVEEEEYDAGPSSHGIKRERGEGRGPRGQPRTEFVDLTIDSDDEVSVLSGDTNFFVAQGVVESARSVPQCTNTSEPATCLLTPALQVLAAKERGETLNCDMTGRGEEGRWRAEKRRAVDLTAGEGDQGQGDGGV